MSLLDRINAHPLPFAQLLGVAFTSAEPDAPRLVVRSALCILGGFAHRRAVMSFTGTLGGAAAFVGLPEGAKGATTIESKTNFVAGAPSSSTLVGRCVSIHRGCRTQIWQTRVETEDGKLIAFATQTQMMP